jgi:putative cardiolipin synthase
MNHTETSARMQICTLRTIIAALAVALGFALSACTPVPLDAAKPESTARTPPAENKLRTSARQITKASQTGSTFVPLSDGNEALGARLRLIEAATDTLDLQYFLIKPDLGGALISHALLRAADRGVRVRFLLDDVFTTVSDQSLSLLNVHPNIEVRIFNPSMRPGPKAAGFVTEFRRINRRMHNKSFTADKAFSIIGGRNIADEYFQLDTSSEFADFDMLVVGPAVPRIAATFDLFWNDGWAIPFERLRASPTEADLLKARVELTSLLKPARSVYDRAVNDPYFRRLNLGQVPIYSGNARVVTDAPDKLKVPVNDGQKQLAKTLLRRMRDAKSDVLLLTPYFVPENYGARLFTDLAKRGVRVRIVTNSLGSTNHAYVYAGSLRQAQVWHSAQNQEV